MNASEPLRTVVWGSGNMGRAAIRAVDAHPGLQLVAVIVANPDKVGRDAGDLAGIDRRLDVVATDDAAGVLATAPAAVAYMASGDVRPEEALADVTAALRCGATVVTPSLYGLYDPVNAPEELRESVVSAALDGGSSLLVSGIDPGWANDVLPALLSGLGGTISSITSQEIMDYSNYDQPDSVRDLIGMGHPLSYEPPMVAATVPTMVWGGQVRLIARALGVELDEVRETLERRPLETTVTNAMGEFAAGTQGALRFAVQGIVDGEAVIVVEHITRIAPECAPDWPTPPEGAGGTHRVVIEGEPRIEVSLQATAEGNNNAAGGNATAAMRLINAIPWLHLAEPGIYDALQVPLLPAVGRVRAR